MGCNHQYLSLNDKYMNVHVCNCSIVVLVKSKARIEGCYLHCFCLFTGQVQNTQDISDKSKAWNPSLAVIISAAYTSLYCG